MDVNSIAIIAGIVLTLSNILTALYTTQKLKADTATTIPVTAAATATNASVNLINELQEELDRRDKTAREEMLRNREECSRKIKELESEVILLRDQVAELRALQSQKKGRSK